VQKVRCAAQNSDKKNGEGYYPPSALSHRVTVMCHKWLSAVWKASIYLPLGYSDKFTKQ